MAKKIQGEQVKQPYKFLAKNITQESDIRFLVSTYIIGEKDFGILRQWGWTDGLNAIAYASMGIFLERMYNLAAFIYQMYKGSPEEVEQLKKCQSQETNNIIIVVSLLVFLGFYSINRYCPRTPRNKLLKIIRQKLDEPPTVVVSKRGEITCD